MHEVLNWLWQGFVVALALFATLRLLDRARANVRYLVCWAAQLLVLALPCVALLESADLRPAGLPRVPVDAVVAVPDVWWTSGLVVATAWLAWMSVGAVRFVRAVLALRRARAQSSPFPEQGESLLAHWLQVRQHGRRSRLVVSDSVGAAAVLGWGRPLIAVSPVLVATLDAEELGRVLVHEWAHVQRRDDLLNVVQIAVRVVAGWHPAVWWIDRQLQVEREIACDETTVVLTGAPKSYAACLVKLASLRGADRDALAAPAVLAASSLRARITRIVSRNAFLAPRWSMGFALVSAVALAFVSVVAAQTRLVEPAVFVFPYESLRLVGERVERLAPIDIPPAASFHEPPASPRRTEAPTLLAVEPTIAAYDQAPEAVLTEEPEPQAPPKPRPTVEPAPPHVSTDGPAVTPPPKSAAAPAESDKSPWTSAADGGKTLGRKSKEAGVATAGAFSRMARRFAGAF